MGDMADLAREQEEDGMFLYPVVFDHKKEWLTKGGEFLSITNMDTSHIQNSIKMIERSNLWRRSSLPYLMEEIKKRSKK